MSRRAVRELDRGELCEISAVIEVPFRPIVDDVDATVDEDCCTLSCIVVVRLQLADDAGCCCCWCRCGDDDADADVCSASSRSTM